MNTPHLLTGCLLKLQIGPVQDFIAQARSTRDLWSGSYLLSWLMAAGASGLVKFLETKAGLSPQDALAAILSPSPAKKGDTRPVHQPLLELHLDGKPASNDGAAVNDDRLTANFTNILLAALPVEHAEAAVKAATQAMHQEWQAIAARVWEVLVSDGFVKANHKERFDQQMKTFPSITWQITPPLDEVDAQRLLARLPLVKELRARLQDRLTASGDTFPAQVVQNSWQLDAVRQLREFKAWNTGGWRRDGSPTEKDSLTGREEAVVGGEEWWKQHFEEKPDGKIIFRRAAAAQNKEVPWPILFRDPGDWLGTFTLVKRLWHVAYLAPENFWNLKASHRREPLGKQFPFPSTAHIALHDPAKNLFEEDGELEAELKAASKADRAAPYYAVLAMDGEAVGAWDK